MVDYRGGISILELIFYVIIFPIAIYLGYRNGFRRSSGWLYLILFSLIRIVGSSMQLYLADHPQSSICLHTTAAILQSVALSPLLLAAYGLLSRINDSIERVTTRPIPKLVFLIAELVTNLALVLTIVGNVKASKQAKENNSNSSNASAAATSTTTAVGGATKGGMGIFVMSLLGLIAMAVFTALKRRYLSSNKGDHNLLMAILASLPFFCVRLVYSLLVTFAKNPHFNILTGSVTNMLVMAILEEFAICALFVAAGCTIRPVSKQVEESSLMENTEYSRVGMQQQQQQQQQQQGVEYGRPLPHY